MEAARVLALLAGLIGALTVVGALFIRLLPFWRRERLALAVAAMTSYLLASEGGGPDDELE